MTNLIVNTVIILNPKNVIVNGISQKSVISAAKTTRVKIEPSIAKIVTNEMAALLKCLIMIMRRV